MNVKQLRKPAWIVALLLVYVLSYAPYLRWRFGSTPAVTTHSSGFAAPRSPYFESHSAVAYKPVELFIDWTPMRSALLAWSTLWDARYKSAMDAAHRTGSHVFMLD